MLHGTDQCLEAFAACQQVILVVGIAVHHPQITKNLEQHPCRTTRDPRGTQLVEQRPHFLTEIADHNLPVGKGSVVVGDFANTLGHGIKQGEPEGGCLINHYVTSRAALHYPPAEIIRNQSNTPCARVLQQIQVERISDSATPRLAGPWPGWWHRPTKQMAVRPPDSSCPPSANRGVRGMTGQLPIRQWHTPIGCHLTCHPPILKYSQYGDPFRFNGCFLDPHQPDLVDGDTTSP